jgi:putative transferase (TIGR04331 family)
MTERLLCTTALESTWRADRPILFLGEWCRRYSRTAAWSNLDAEVLPYHWDDRAKLYADYRYLRGLHERLLRDLAAQLNAAHGVDRGLRYWRILVGPWLGFFVQMLFDRWTSIQDALHRFEIGETLVLPGGDEAAVPNDMEEFSRWFVADEWNHRLYASILTHCTEVRCTVTAADAPAPAPHDKPGAGLRRFKQSVVRWYCKGAALLTRDRDIFLLGTYLPAADEIRMHRTRHQVPQLWASVPAERTATNLDERRWKIPGESRNAFEDAARTLVALHLPRSYLEGYGSLLGQIESLAWPSRPKAIWTSSAHRSDDVFKAWAADRVERGSPLVIGQHGGHYGTGLWCFAEEHDIEISDRYLSWGWSDERERRVTPVGQLKNALPLGVKHASQPDALLVTCSMPRYSYWLFSAVVGRQWLDYFADQCSFVESLPERIRAALVVRLYPEDFGWDQAARWRDRFPDLRLDHGASRIAARIRSSRIYISTYNATTFLESMSMNVPTVIYWNERHWELRDAARADFEELERVGIFHATPEKAAQHLAAVWDDVEAWWTGPAVVAALERFKRKYCDARSGIVKRLAHVLEATAAGGPSKSEGRAA